MADVLADITERFEYCKNAWAEIRDQAAIDMQFVGGDPWTDADKKQRSGRPMIAPEEMGQYFNQVINALRANPRGVKFSPVGNGANDQTARFYQNKAREIEYRSHAQIAYMQAAENAIQRSYGYVRVETQYANPRSANQELVITGFPDPDMVMLDPDALRPDSSDMQYAYVFRWSPQREVQKRRRPKLTNFGAFQVSHPSWIQGDQVLEAEYWTITTRPRVLILADQQGKPIQIFADEFDALGGAKREAQGLIFRRELRQVDYPKVCQYLTDGIEVFDETEWPGKYIPIVSCYGKVIWVPDGAQTKRVILSMTRFGRDPWKAYCYACCQELEVLAMAPKAPLLIARGSMTAPELQAVTESTHKPKGYLTYGDYDADGKQHAPPQRVDYVQAQYLQSIEIVKEGYRRAIQSAMGSNFLPTQAQKRNEKSGKALDKMEQAATQGTYHFVNSFEDMLRQVGVIEEDLIPSIYSQQGETGIMEADGKSRIVPINDPQNPDAFSTQGDHVVTVSTAPSSDSEAEAAADYTELIVGQLPMVAQISGPKAAAAVLAMATRMRNLGPRGEQLADLIEPPEYKQQADGQPPNPQVLAAKAQIQKLEGMLQQAAQEKQADTTKHQADFAKAQMVEQATTDRELQKTQMEIAARIEVARITAAKQAADTQMEAQEESIALGIKLAHEAREAEKDRLHQEKLHHRDRVGAMTDRLHESVESAKDRTHERLQADQAQHHAVDLAAMQPDPTAQDGASV